MCILQAVNFVSPTQLYITRKLCIFSSSSGVVVVVVKFFNKNFVRRKVDNANIQTETDIKQSKQVQLHNSDVMCSDGGATPP